MSLAPARPDSSECAAILFTCSGPGFADMKVCCFCNDGVAGGETGWAGWWWGGGTVGLYWKLFHILQLHTTEPHINAAVNCEIVIKQELESEYSRATEVAARAWHWHAVPLNNESKCPRPLSRYLAMCSLLAPS